MFIGRTAVSPHCSDLFVIRADGQPMNSKPKINTNYNLDIILLPKPEPLPIAAKVPRHQNYKDIVTTVLIFPQIGVGLTSSEVFSEYS